MATPKKHVLTLGFDDGTEAEVLIKPSHRVLAREKLGAEADVEKLTYYAAFRALGVSNMPFEVWMDTIIGASEDLVPFASTANSDT